MPPNNPVPITSVPKKHSLTIIISFVVLVLLLIGAVSFGVWALMGKQDYKNNVDKKVADQVAVASKQISEDKDKELAEKEKLPLKTYQDPAAYGNVLITYPKTWGAYVVENSSNGTNTPIDGFFHPGFVPDTSGGKNSFALRMQVVASPYSTELKKFDSYIKQGKTTLKPYQAPKVTSVTGSRVDGQIDSQKQGNMVLFPLRDKTLKVWTEAAQFQSDFEKNVLPNLTFVP
jgi:hypothetical protein